METLFGAGRGVIYLESAVDALRAVDGSREEAITTSVEKFLDSPPSAFNKSVSAHVWQVRDLGTNTRAFATWCQNETIDCELCIVHYIYRKRNEKHAFDQLTAFDNEGESFQDRVSGMSQDRYESWKAQVESEDTYRTEFTT